MPLLLEQASQDTLSSRVWLLDREGGCSSPSRLYELAILIKTEGSHIKRLGNGKEQRAKI
jgi:hypothetical protein